MRRPRLISLVALLVTCCSLPALTAVAGDSPLEGIPETAEVLVRLKTPDATVKKVADFAGRLKDEYRKFIVDGAGALGSAIDNPGQVGVDRKRDWWLIIIGESGKTAGIVFGVPASDAPAMKKTLGDRFKIAEYENWVFYSESEHSLSEFEARKSGKRKSVSSTIDKRSREIFDKCDLAAYVNVRELRRVYRSEIDGLKSQAKAFIDQIANTTANMPSQGVNVQAMFKVYADLANGFFQVVEDADALAAGVQVADKGIELEACLVVAPSTPTDRFLERNHPSDLKTLGRLPADRVLYFGGAGDLGGLTKFGAQMGLSMLQGDEQLQKKLSGAFKEIENLQIKALCGTLALGNPNEGVIVMSTVTEVDHPEKMRDVSIEFAQAMGSLKTPMFKQTATVKRDAEKVGTHSVDLMTIKQEFESDPTGMASSFIKILYGPEGFATRISTMPGLLVQSIGGGKRPHEELLKSLESGSGAAGQSAWSAARAQLPAAVNAIALIDVPRLATEVLRVLADLKLPILPIDDAAVAELQKEINPSYLGIAGATEPQGARLKIQIPFEQALGISKLVEFARTKLGRPGA